MSDKIKILSKTTCNVVTETYDLEVEGLKIVYIEYINDKGKVIDTQLRSDMGFELTDAHLLGTRFNSVAELVEEIQESVDKQ